MAEKPVLDVTDALMERVMLLHPKLIDLSLDRLRTLMADLGNPQDHLPPVIHVAGTNGKGSLVAFLRAIFEAAGLTAHVYTSPHLVRFNERIVVAGKTITDEALSALLDECERVNAGRPITFFEITTAAAYLAFSRTPADVVLLEVGMGGRLDATNLVQHPVLTAITPISLDHQQHLGATPGLIAAEKAGIFKRGVPAVIGRQQFADAEAAITVLAEAQSVPLHRLGAEWSMTRTPDGFRFTDAAGSLDLGRPSLAGWHQYDNAATAVAAARLLRHQFDLPDAAIRQGVASASWPARLQHLTKGPLVDLLPAGTELWLDGGHNGGCAEALAPTFVDWEKGPDAKPLALVFGMLDSKAPSEFLGPLSDLISAVAAVSIPGEAHARPASDQAAAARDAGIADVREAESVEDAVRQLTEDGRPKRILICGSLYLAGRVLAQNS